MTALRGRRVLLGVTGGIAAYKAASLARELQRAGAEVTAVLTASATRFIGADTFAGLTGHPAYTSLWESPGEVVHVRLAQAHELAVIAPATGNLIAKLAHGLADDLLSATLLEFDGPVVVAPAMHAGMWAAPATQANVRTLLARGVRFVGPVEGALAHGDEGMGRMSEPGDDRRGRRERRSTFHGPDDDGRQPVGSARPRRRPDRPTSRSTRSATSGTARAARWGWRSPPRRWLAAPG